ncbi:MAG: hypothetical protein HC824_01355 [Synechococcales cyanobacterium RM1_1_8]|nr:hypothetical protein [Synechococcales cyanobacterium RM1_1_8]
MLLNWTIPAPVLPEVRLSEAGPTRSLDGLFGQHPAQAWSQPEQWHAAAAQLAQEFDRQMAFLVSVGLPPAIAQQQPF